MKWWLALLALAGGLGGSAHAEQSADGMAWLGRMVTAAQKLSYTGTFVYQSDNHTETSRITHVVDAAGERERLEVLDGTPREVVRHNDEVKCFLPGERLVIVEQQAQRRTFPARLPESFAALPDYYIIRMGAVTRIAGFDSQLLILEPKDSYRYGHMLWADVNSGLLVKARMVNDRNQVIEQFAFTQLQIGGPIDAKALRATFASKAAEWQVHNVKAVSANIEDSDWVFKTQIPGFKKSAGMLRRGQSDKAQTLHVVFSDGLAAISVFIEPLGSGGTRSEEGLFSAGAINVYKRTLNDHLLVVLGEVPAPTLKALGDGIELRRK